MPDALFAALSAAMEGRLAQWNRGQGFAAIRADWLKRAAGLGETLQRSIARTPAFGPSSRALMRTDACCSNRAEGYPTITAGEVFGFGEC